MIIKDKGLMPEILSIVRDKHTELPSTGQYNDFGAAGSYLCRRCGFVLFRSHTKFQASCGWPSFDETITNAVVEQKDADGRRIEIICGHCQAHLGHVFRGEQYTEKNQRYCVNSLSLDFVADPQLKAAEEAIFAAGCFWGVEYYLKKFPGVVKTEVGYIGGHTEAPTYEKVCTGNTGHLEAIRVLYDPEKTDYKKLTQYFFEIHDPFQTDGQGPDIGEQYLSAIFYYNDEQKNTAKKLIETLQKNNPPITTQILPVTPFWSAEEYHQNYYEKTNKQPYCHVYKKRF